MLHKRLGNKFDFEAAKELSPGTASEMIDKALDQLVKLNGKANDVQQEEPAKEAEQTPTIDGVGYGLCFKKTMDYFRISGSDIDYVVENFADRLDKIVKLYVENRERILHGSSSSPLVYQGHGTYLSQARSDENNASCNCEVI